MDFGATHYIFTNDIKGKLEDMHELCLKIDGIHFKAIPSVFIRFFLLHIWRYDTFVMITYMFNVSENFVYDFNSSEHNAVDKAILHNITTMSLLLQCTIIHKL